MVIGSHLLSQVGQSYLTFGISNMTVVRGLNGFWPSAFPDASLEVKECASEWEQEVCELGLGAWALALCPGWDRSTAWASGSDAAKFPCLSGSSSKQPEDMHQGRESTADSAKRVKQRVLAKGKKKGKETKKPMWEIVQLRLSGNVILLHPSLLSVLHCCPVSLPLSHRCLQARGDLVQTCPSEGCRTAEDWQFCQH